LREQSEEAIRSSPNDPKKFDTSGKSPAYVQHRKKFRARAGDGVGLFQSSRVFRHCEEQREENPIVAERTERI